MTIVSTTMGKNPLGNGVALIVNKKKSKVQHLDAILKMTEWSQFRDKTFNITVIQVYAPTVDVKEAEVDWFYENLKTF